MDKHANAETLIRRSQDIVASEIDGEYLIMSIEQGSYISLRDVSARIWVLLEEPRSFGYLCETLLQEYSVDRETCEAEVSDFLHQMAKDQLITMEKTT